MSQPKDLKKILLIATSSSESMASLYPELIQYLSQPNNFTEKSLKEFVGTLRDIITLKTYSPLQKFYAAYLLLKASEIINKQSIMIQIAEDDELLTEIFRIAQFDLNKDTMPNERGKGFFGKPTSKIQQEFAVNFVRLHYETLIHWGSKYGSADPKNRLHIYHYLAEALKKKGRLPFKLYFVEKNYDMSYNLAFWVFRDGEPPTYDEPSTDVPVIPSTFAMKKQFSFNQDEPRNRVPVEDNSESEEEETEKSLDLELPTIEAIDNYERKSLKQKELKSRQGDKIKIPNFEEVQSPLEGPKLREKPHNHNKYIPEDLDKHASATPNFKSSEKQKVVQNENIKSQAPEEQSRSAFERKTQGTVTKTDDFTKKQETETEDLNKFMKKGHRLSMAGSELSRQDSERGTLNSKVSKLRQKKLEQELVGIQSSIRHSLEKMMSSPASFKSQNSFSKSDWANLSSSQKTDEMNEKLPRTSLLKKISNVSASSRGSMEGTNPSTDAECTPKHDIELKQALGFSEFTRTKSLAGVEMGINFARSPNTLAKHKHWNSLFPEENKSQKKYDPFSKVPLPEESPSSTMKLQQPLEVVPEDVQEGRNKRRERLTKVFRETIQPKTKNENYEIIIADLQDEVTRLKQENQELKRKDTLELFQSSNSLDRKIGSFTESLLSGQSAMNNPI